VTLNEKGGGVKSHYLLQRRRGYDAGRDVKSGLEIQVLSRR